MTYIVPAVQALQEEVASLRPKGKVTPSGEPDGLGYIRSLTFDSATGKWITPLLDLLNDERIESVEEVGNKVVVTFVADPRADHADQFGLAAIDDVLAE